MEPDRSRFDVRGDDDTDSEPDRWLAAGLLVLAARVAGNSLLGPLAAGVVDYPLSETLVNQTIGLEAVSLAIVAPWSAAAAVLAFRGHREGPVAAVPAAAYAAYMFLQYVVGPQYLEYRPIVALHLGIFVLSGGVLLRAWNRISVDHLPVLSRRQELVFATVLLLLAGFTVSRYAPAFQGLGSGGAIPAEYGDDASMYWSIFLLDLGVVVPVTLGAGWGLVRGAAWARKAVYGIVGWFALVPISVSAMSITMVLNDDPNAAVGNAVGLGVVALLFTAVAAWLYRPLLQS